MPCSATITKAYAYSRTGPTGADLIFDINKNGSTIWSTQANRVKIVAGASTGTQTSFNTVDLVENDRLDLDIDQIGSTLPGADVTVELTLIDYLGDTAINQYVESSGESSTTSIYSVGGYQNKVTLTFTPASTGYYEIIWSIEYTHYNAAQDVCLRFWDGTTTYSEGRLNADNGWTSNPKGYSLQTGMRTMQLTGGISKSFTWQWCVYATGTGYVRQAYILARRIY